MIGVGLGFLIILTAFPFFMGADNVIVNASKSESHGVVSVSIGSLKGAYTINSFEINESGFITIPYDASIGTGKVFMYIKDSDQIVWQRKITSTKNGRIVFNAIKGTTYEIGLHTEKAKKIALNISLN